MSAPQLWTVREVLGWTTERFTKDGLESARLDAEVLIDALCAITGTHENYASPIPEPFTFLPEFDRTIRLADGSITSPFLEMFGRPPRDTGADPNRSPPSAASSRPTPSTSSTSWRVGPA